MSGARDPRSDAALPRVLMVVRLFHPWIGGTERQAAKLASRLIARGANVRVVTGRWFHGTRRYATVDGVPVHRNHTLWQFFGIRGLRKFGNYFYIVTLWWYLWRHRSTYDVLHVHGLSFHTFAAVAIARGLHKPVITKLANSGSASDIRKMRDERELKLSRLMLPIALRSDVFVALNPTVTAELIEVGVPSDRIVELPNGVIVRGSERDRTTLREPAVILYVGRLHRQKGVDTLLRAVALLQDRESPPIRLRIVGEGPAEPALRALAADLDIVAAVDFVGRREDVTPEFDGADIFVLPSHAEGMSNALLEAMASGVPPVVSDVPGNRDVVTDATTGLLARLQDPHALADAIDRLLHDHALRASVGAAARRTAERDYGFERVVDWYLALYSDVIAGRSPTHAEGTKS